MKWFLSVMLLIICQVAVAQEDSVLVTPFSPEPINIDSVKSCIQYPKELRHTGLKAKINVRVLINEQGLYEKHEVRKSPHPLCTKEVEKCIPFIRCKTRPMIEGMKVTKQWLAIPFILSPDSMATDFMPYLDVYDVDEEPRILNLDTINKERGCNGCATFTLAYKALIDTNGNCITYFRTKPTQFPEGCSCETPLHKLRCAPARKAGKPVPFWISFSSCMLMR